MDVLAVAWPKMADKRRIADGNAFCRWVDDIIEIVEVEGRPGDAVSP